jgi:peptide/nickel transport system permease protein
MARYIVRRLLWVVVLLVLVSALTFVVFYVFPSSDPAALRAGRNASPAVIAQIRHNLGLDRSLPYQYVHYMGRVFLHLDFGYSFQNDHDVKGLILSRLPATISLAFGAVVLWLVGAFAVGTISAIRRRSLLDRAAMGGALLAISAPVYWLGLVMLYLFANDIGVIKIFAGANTYSGITSGVLPWAWHLVLPWLVLAAAYSALYARLLRANLIDVMGEDYIRTARAKGLGEGRVIFRHGMRSAVTPIVTALGLDIGSLLGGAVLTESVFNIPGVGRLSYDAIIHSDLPVIQGVVLVAAFFIVTANLVVDVAYAFLDPRVRYS